MLVLYRQKALPILAAFFLYALYSYSLSSVFTLTAQLLAALISQTLYFFSTGKRGAVSFGRSQLTTLRIVWLVCCNALLFISIDHWFQSNTASASSIMAGAVTLHYVRFDRHQRRYSYIYRLFITVVTSSNAMGSDLHWPCFDIPCMGNNAHPVGILYKQLYSAC